MLGQQMTVQEVLAEILADRIFYDDSRGGVTFSGGEPLLQFEFLQAALQACRERGIETAVDTCGFAPRAHLLAIAQVTDLFLYDLKLMDEAAHVEFTGVSNRRILENLQELGRVHRNLWLRIPIIPTVNDSARELDAMAGFANTIAGIRQIHLLPYHKTGIHKHQRLGREYQLAGLVPPSAEQMEAVAARFSTQGLTPKIGG
jgi:pyruvate formate lyase activating enzyme